MKNLKILNFPKIILILLPMISVPLKSQNLRENLEIWKKKKETETNLKIQKAKTKKIKAITGLVPTINYNPIANDFAVGISIRGVIDALSSNKQAQIQQEILEENIKNSYEKKYYQLKEDLFEIDQDSLEILVIEQNTELEKKLFDIKKGEFQNNEIDYETYIKHEIQYNKTLNYLRERKAKHSFLIEKFKSKTDDRY